MKNKLVLVMFALCLIASVAFGQTDTTAEVVTDDATMARLRVGYIVHGGPNIDVLLNGEIAMNPGQPQANIPCCQFTGYMYLEPGTYSLAIVPTGKGEDEALLGPLDVTLEAGHRYTVATMGQVDDENLTPLVLDETAIFEQVKTPESKEILLLLNNLEGATIDFDRERGGARGVEYGDYGIINYAASGLANGFEGPCNNFVIAFNDEVLVDEAGSCGPVDPNKDFIVAFMGRYPGSWDTDFIDRQSSNTSDLNVIEFLQGFSGLGAEQEGHVLSFDTFLQAVEIAGLTELLETGGPYLLLVPTDEAFTKLPQSQREVLIGDPEALANLLRYHIVEGYYPPGSLSGEEYGRIDRTLTNMMGAELTLSNVGTWFTRISGVPAYSFVGDIQFYTVANGTRIRPIPVVIPAALPPKQ